MKRCIGSAKPHRTVFRFFERYYDAKEVIHKRISWNWENISKSGPKVRPKIVKNWIFNEKVHRIRKTSRTVFHFFARYYDAKEVIHKRISWNPENISKSGPNLGQKFIEYLMKRCIGSAKPHRTVFRFFERYYDAKEVIHMRISWNPENISKSGPKIWPKIVKNWIFNEKVHRIRKTSRTVFHFFARYYDAKEVIHKRISWNQENISKSVPKLGQKFKKSWIFNEKVHRICKTSQNRFSLFRKVLRW